MSSPDLKELCLSAIEGLFELSDEEYEARLQRLWSAIGLSGTPRMPRKVEGRREQEFVLSEKGWAQELRTIFREAPKYSRVLVPTSRVVDVARHAAKKMGRGDLVIDFHSTGEEEESGDLATGD